MDVQLKSLSPLSFAVARVGELVRIEYKPPKINEYREKIGPASACYLVMKGRTKIGMIPSEVVLGNEVFLKKRVCRIVSVDKDSGVIVVSLVQG